MGRWPRKWWRPIRRDLTVEAAPAGGHHSWAVEEVRQFEQRHPLGTKARLALALLLWTGVRRSDLVKLGKQHVRDGKLRFTQQKNRKRKPVQITVPILPELQKVIDASPAGDLTFLVTGAGAPDTVWGFGNCSGIDASRPVCPTAHTVCARPAPPRRPRTAPPPCS